MRGYGEAMNSAAVVLQSDTAVGLVHPLPNKTRGLKSKSRFLMRGYSETINYSAVILRLIYVTPYLLPKTKMSCFFSEVAGET